MVRLIIFSTALLISSPAYSYLDPGLGSLLLQSILGGVAVTLGAISVFWQKIKSFFFLKKIICASFVEAYIKSSKILIIDKSFISYIK